MITFKQYLSEGRGKPTSPEAFIKWADANCAKYMNGERFLFRGFTGGESATMVGNSSGETPRKSVGGIPNNYTLWIDGHPKFKDFPKRSRSFIATTSLSKASDFGKPYLMFIKDTDKVAAVLTNDIWVKIIIPGQIEVMLLDLNEITEVVLRKYDLGHNEKYFQLQNSLQHITLKRLREWYEDKENIASHYERLLVPIIKTMEDKKWNDLWEVWNGLVSPDIFGITTGADVSAIPAGEAWVDGECGFLALQSNQVPDADKEIISTWLKEKNTELFNVVTNIWNRSTDY